MFRKKKRYFLQFPKKSHSNIGNVLKFYTDTEIFFIFHSAEMAKCKVMDTIKENIPPKGKLSILISTKHIFYAEVLFILEFGKKFQDRPMV